MAETRARDLADIASTATGGIEGTEVKSTGESGGAKYLREDGDGTSSWQTVVQPTAGISNGNHLTANANVADNDFLRVDGTAVEGRTAAETLSDIGAAPLASPTFTGTTTVADFVPATPLSHRNMIINGAMQVSQRGASHTSVSATAYQLDRFETTLQGLGTYTITRDTTDAPKSEGFGNSYKIDCTSADASPGSSDFFFISHKMEGQNLQHLQKGSSSAKSLTLSFWCRCTKTGNIQVNIYDWDNARIIAQTVTINSADTWEKKTLTFPGDTTGALTNHVSTSLVVEWWLDKGSNFSGGSVPTSWATFNNTNRAVGTTLALGDNTANNFYITGVQLELGSVATPFEHRSYGEELARCQRYFEQLLSQISNQDFLCSGFNYSASQPQGVVRFEVEKRASPTMGSNTYGIAYQATGENGRTNVTPSFYIPSPKSVMIYASTSGLTAGQGVNLCNRDDGAGQVFANAEL